MTLKEILDNWESESNAANDCIIEILESYMEFVTNARVFTLTMLNTDFDKRKQAWIKFKNITEQCKAHWEPILEHAKQAKEKANERNNTGD